MEVLKKNSYYNVITSEHRQRPNYMKFVESLSEPLFDYSDLLASFDIKFDVDFATGEQLDFLGGVFGVSRYVTFKLEDGTYKLNDDDYRVAIKSKIAQNHWDGTTQGLQEIWKTVFPDAVLLIQDNFDMSAIITVKSVMTENQLKMLSAGMLIPRPAGVQYYYAFAEDIIFAYDMGTDMFKGYDLGTWLKLQY